MNSPVTGTSSDEHAFPPEKAGHSKRTLSSATVRVYAKIWAGFQVWCRAREDECLPAAPQTVAFYLETCAAKLGPSRLRTVLAAIAQRHRNAGLPSPAGDPVIVRTMASLLARAPRPRPAVTFAISEVRQLLESCQGSVEDGLRLSASRDRALMLTSFAAGLRRSELVALDHDDVHFTPQGMTLQLAVRARVGSTASEVVVARETEAPLCAVRALEAWLRHAGIDYGPVFVHISAAGTLEGRLTGNGVWKILRRRAALAGLDVSSTERVCPQALRKGFKARNA